MNTLTREDVIVPADVPKDRRETYIRTYLKTTHRTGNLMLFAGDQKFEHLNDDFFGAGIHRDDNDPGHLFRIAQHGTIGVFATQFGLIARYGASYPDIPYLVKLNSKSHLLKGEPLSTTLVEPESILTLIQNGINIVGMGYTVYLGSEHEETMFAQAGRIINVAHQHGLIGVIWCYPRGAAVPDERDPHLIAGAAGVAACLGADFVKVNAPRKQGEDANEMFKEAVLAAGRCGVITTGGSSIAEETFLKGLWEQINITGTRGNATGRNIHQKSLQDAIRMCDATSSITLGGKDLDFAMKVYNGKDEFKIED
ncbi:Fructose-bisphosphate aldolase class 1 [Candidatus Entotheonellaceae bacterium PAL068K]